MKDILLTSLCHSVQYTTLLTARCHCLQCIHWLIPAVRIYTFCTGYFPLLQFSMHTLVNSCCQNVYFLHRLLPAVTVCIAQSVTTCNSHNCYFPTSQCAIMTLVNSNCHSVQYTNWLVSTVTVCNTHILCHRAHIDYTHWLPSLLTCKLHSSLSVPFHILSNASCPNI